MLVSSIALLGAAFLVTIHPFLSLHQKVDATVLVVEGWISPGAIAGAAREFESGPYTRIYVTGGPIEGPSAEYSTYAEQGYRRLERQGVSTQKVTQVVSEPVQKDRTYASARSLRAYFQTNSVQVDAFNIFTTAAHARRSHLLFEKAFGNHPKIGVIPCPPTEYRADRWWTASSGVKEIISESAAYLYARLLFWPPATEVAPATRSANEATPENSSAVVD